MSVFASLFSTTAMLLIALSMGALGARSVCSSSNWRREWVRVGESMKTHPSLPWRPAGCQGSRIHWRFTGRLYE